MCPTNNFNELNRRYLTGGGRGQRILSQGKDTVKSRKDPEILTAVRRQATGLKVADRD